MFKKSLQNQKVERRLSPRKRLDAMVNVVREESQTTERSVNYSLTGLFLRSNFPEKYQIKDQVNISFTDETGGFHSRTGEVVRKSRKGIAIHYQEEKEN